MDGELQARWRTISQYIQDAASMITIPRQYFELTLSSTVNLHIFVDASLKAYGVVAYIHQGNNTSIILSKTRVSPHKALTLPKLEHSDAVFGARLGNLVVMSFQHTQIQFDIHLWSDSQITLYWISGNKRVNTFVSHRVKEITTLLFSASSWNYCPLAQNPADHQHCGNMALPGYHQGISGLSGTPQSYRQHHCL